MGSDTADGLARTTSSHPAVRVLARAGYAANGVVHLLIGAVVLAVAFGGSGEGDQQGAFRAIAQAPLGGVALWALALALAALTLWYIAEGILASGESTARRWGRRLAEWGKAIVYASLAATAVSIALGARPDGDESTRSMSRALLALPAGPFLVGAIGVGVVVVGGVFVVRGVTRGFLPKITPPGGILGRVVTATGVVGYIAKGVALAVVGALLTTAAVTVDPGASGGLDAAIKSLLALPFGTALVAAVGIGLIAYAVYCFFRARYARL
ncbi:DUF1206 domain-containing protein [Microbacterium limosum]|uniref:DUF1206 domain-containing protein n=1 Tax=Microbacterium limosum TaxID=3079935 RepID=A0AAU0MFB7_9MICO|nr:DUF1206 domain-containing protein [Microbacterium sp. Y20]WOQ68674.1 DUF1206 domain-containing protein [Microbacterium sp. Y20]